MLLSALAERRRSIENEISEADRAQREAAAMHAEVEARRAHLAEEGERLMRELRGGGGGRSASGSSKPLAKAPNEFEPTRGLLAEQESARAGRQIREQVAEQVIARVTAAAPRAADEGRRGALRQSVRLGRRDGGSPVSAVAKRYAKALLALGAESGEGESVGRELDRVAQVFATGPLQAFAGDTTLHRNTRRAVVARVSEALGVSRLLRNFLGLLAENNRLRDLSAIRSQYQRLEDRSLGRVRARVLSAQPLSEESRARIHEIFERQMGKRVIAETRRRHRSSSAARSWSSKAGCSTVVCERGSSV